MNTTTNTAITTTLGAGRLARRVATLMVLALCAVWAQAPAASAQLSSAIRVKVPFAFSVAEKSMPAGVYTLRKVTPNTLVLRGEHGEAAMFTAVTVENDSRGGATELRFNRYGDSYFLSEVLPTAAETGYRVPAGETEAQLTTSGAAAQTVSVRLTAKN